MNTLQSIDNIEKLSMSDKIIIDDSGALKAVVLRYDDNREDAAPTIVAKGKGYIAKQIIESAKRNNISIIKDGKLVDSLIPIALGQKIPIELYEVVSEIYILLSELDREVRDL